MRPARSTALVGGALVAIVSIALPSRPAAADPARPGNVSSTVVSTEPSGAPISAKVVGGDSFLELTVRAGHEVVVDDYDTPPHPYLRFAADGTVFENVNSKAYYQNRSRYSTDAPDKLPIEPAWRAVGSGGTYAWHDHRVHYMARSAPPLTSWTVPLTLDSQPASINGTYGPVPAPSPLPWLALAAVTGALVAAAGRRVLRVGALGAVASALVALPIAIALGRMPAAGGLVRTGGLVIAGAVAAIGALAVRASPAAAALLAGSGLALALWAVRRLDVLSHGVLVTTAPATLDRLSVTLCLGIGIAALITGVRAVLMTPVEALSAASS